MGDSGTENTTAKISLQKGTLNLPGSTATSKKVAEKLLARDLDTNHCYYDATGFHNHLSHHILVAYDLGAPPELLEAVSRQEEGLQRPIMLQGVEGVIQPGSINEKNWTEFVGDEKAYAAYVHFFREQIKLLGPVDAVEKYIFSEEANAKNVEMLVAFYSGVIHPFIQLGFAAEFGCDINLVSCGLASTAIHKFTDLNIVTEGYKGDGYTDTAVPAFKHHAPSDKQLSLLEVLAEVSKSPALEPVLPYDNDHDYPALIRRIEKCFAPGSGRPEEIAKICSKWDLPNPLTPADLDRVIEEAIWAVTLLLAGTSKPGRKPRLDFFLMHGLTSVIFIRPLCQNLVKNPESQVRMIRSWLVSLVIECILRGRPQIDCDVLMGYTDKPLPPNYESIAPKADASSINPSSGPQDAINHWTLIIQSALRAPDVHVAKSIRALLYGAIHYGIKGSGELPGAKDSKGVEVIPGIGKVDGSIFLRAAGVIMDALGWVDWGQPAGLWDRSAHGWDDAWKDEE